MIQVFDLFDIQTIGDQIHASDQSIESMMNCQ